MRTAVLRTSMLAALAAGVLAAPGAGAQQTVRLPEKDRPLALRTTPVFSVGSAEGREWEMFTRVEQVAFDRADNLYVLDGGANRVLMFDRAGRFVRQIGKKGGGPGEFQSILGMAVLADGTLAVADLAQGSYALFGRDGKYQRSVPFPEEFVPPLNFAETGVASHPRGGVVGPMRRDPLRANGMRTSPLRSPIVWHSFAAAAKPVRLFEAPSEGTEQTQARSPRPGDQMVMTRINVPVFSPRLNWGILPGGGMVVSHTPGYTVKLLDAGGRVVRHIQRPMKVRQVTERDKERERDRRREAMRTGAGMRMVISGSGGGGAPPRPLTPSKEQIEQSVREMEFAETIPAIQNMRVDGAGRVWVERTGESWGEPGPIDIITVNGRYLGTLTGQKLPAAFSPSGRVAYIEEDDLGVQRVVVRQLPRF